MPLSAPPRRSARHPSSSEEGSVFNNSPPDSGGVAPWAPGWLSAGRSLSSASKASPFRSRSSRFGFIKFIIPASSFRRAGRVPKCRGPGKQVRATRSSLDRLLRLSLFRWPDEPMTRSSASSCTSRRRTGSGARRTGSGSSFGQLRWVKTRRTLHPFSGTTQGTEPQGLAFL
jgi:hypothetical protein